MNSAPTAVRVFPGQAGAAGEARRWVRSLTAVAWAAPVDDVELVAGEPFANAVLHSRSGNEGGLVTVAVTEDGVIHVHDLGAAGPAPWAMPTASLPDGRGLAEAGQGLLLVAALSGECGLMPAAQCAAAGPDDPAAEAGGCCAWSRPGGGPGQPASGTSPEGRKEHGS
jgi:serine/threonine-protein kinase RsbW